MNNSSLTTLRILLVLSYIGSGFSMLAYLMFALLMPQMQQVVAENPGLLPDQFVTAYERLFEVPRLYFLAIALLNFISLVGITLMWRLRPSGFHCYTLAQLLLLILPLLFLGKGYVGIGDIMFTVLFIALYYFTLRRLGIMGNGDAPNLPTPTDNNEEPSEE